MLKKLLKMLFDSWVYENTLDFKSLLEKDSAAKILDLGCGNGLSTLNFAQKIGSRNIYALEIVDKDIKNALKIGIRCEAGDLNGRFPFKSDTFDVILSYFSIEHIYNTRSFINETKRVLKPGGYCVISSDNLSSWLNIFAMIFTFQPFSLASGIADTPVGNPFSLRTNEESMEFTVCEDKSSLGTRSHVRVLSLRALVDALQKFGLKVVAFGGAGYPPFFGLLSRVLSKIDPYHSHFYFVKAVKSKKE